MMGPTPVPRQRAFSACRRMWAHRRAHSLTVAFAMPRRRQATRGSDQSIWPLCCSPSSQPSTPTTTDRRSCRYRRNATRRSSVDTSPPCAHCCSSDERSRAKISASRLIAAATSESAFSTDLPRLVHERRLDVGPASPEVLALVAGEERRRTIVVESRPAAEQERRRRTFPEACCISRVTSRSSAAVGRGREVRRREPRIVWSSWIGHRCTSRGSASAVSSRSSKSAR